MKKAALLFFLLVPALALADPPLTTVYSSTQTTSFSSSNFGDHRTITTLYPDNGFWSPVHPPKYDCCCGLWVRAWDDPRLPFEFQNDLYVRNWLALGYFFHPGERAYLYPAYAR